MNWKQIIYTAIVTLVVTILSGILVNWFTNEKLKDTEDLRYQVDKISSFKSDSIKITLFKIEVFNLGSVKSENLNLKIIFDDKVEIIDAVGVIKRTQNEIESSNKNNSALNYKIESFFPSENLEINIALKNSVSDPRIILQSKNAIGKPIEEASKNSKNIPILGISLIIIGLTLLLLIPILYFSTKFYKKFFGYPQSLNNTAFLLIHNLQFKLAESLLYKEIQETGGSASELANYALVQFILNPSEDNYQSLLRMAEFVSKSNWQYLIISFNRMIIFAKKEEYDKLETEFLFCIKKDKKEFKKWYNFSLIISQMKEKDKMLSKLLVNLEQKYFA